MIKPLHEYLKIKKTLPDNSRQIYFWIHVFGVQQGDIQRLAIIDPNGNTLVEKKLVIEENQARRLSIIRKLLTSNTWLPGKYTGIYKLIRSNNEDNKTIIYKKYNLDVIQYQQ